MFAILKMKNCLKERVNDLFRCQQGDLIFFDSCFHLPTYQYNAIKLLMLNIKTKKL